MEISKPTIRWYDASLALVVALISSFLLFIITGLPNSVLAGYLTGMLYYYDKKRKYGLVEEEGDTTTIEDEE